MLRSLSLVAFAALVATPAAAAAEQWRYSSKGDGFSAELHTYQDCSSTDLYVYGSDYATKVGPGQPQRSNYMYAYASAYDCTTNSYGWGYVDLGNARITARGTNASASASGTIDLQFGHWEPGTVEECWSWEAQCYDADWNWCDCANECAYEYEAGEYCYYPEVWVDDGVRTMGFNLTLAPTGVTERGTNMGSYKGPNGMYRYRYSGTTRYSNVTGTWVLEGQDLLANAWSWATLWSTNSGELSLWRY